MNFQSLSPGKLADLFGVFIELERGFSVSLATKGTPAYPADPAPREKGPWLGVCSSGSTGSPKLVWREWPKMLAEASREPRVRGWTWASPFRPDSFAGVQVALQAWAGRGRIISLDVQWPECWDRLATEQVDALSCTPTYLDLLLQNEPAAVEGPGEQRSRTLRAGRCELPTLASEVESLTNSWQPKQVTLGGEPFRPALGRRLRSRFANAHVTVVYASAEYGVLLKTHRVDGWYEADHLTKKHPNWRVSNGQLELNLDGSWRGTGDQVEIQNELIRVIGRADAVANIAGSKVNLAEVGRLAEEVPGIRRARAVAQANPVTGQIVCLKYSLETPADEQVVTQALEAHLRKHLRKEAWPRLWELEEVQLGPNAKSQAR
jgi:acyl-CoA synthetase (AMP-forming)/AMP-acid ligase II